MVKTWARSLSFSLREAKGKSKIILVRWRKNWFVILLMTPIITILLQYSMLIYQAYLPNESKNFYLHRWSLSSNFQIHLKIHYLLQPRHFHHHHLLIPSLKSWTQSPNLYIRQANNRTRSPNHHHNQANQTQIVLSKSANNPEVPTQKILSQTPSQKTSEYLHYPLLSSLTNNWVLTNFRLLIFIIFVNEEFIKHKNKH